MPLRVQGLGYLEDTKDSRMSCLLLIGTGACRGVMRNCGSLASSTRLSESQQWKREQGSGQGGDWCLMVTAAELQRYFNVPALQACCSKVRALAGKTLEPVSWDKNMHMEASEDSCSVEGPKLSELVDGVVSSRGWERLTFCLALLHPGGHKSMGDPDCGWKSGLGSAMSCFWQVDWLLLHKLAAPSLSWQCHGCW